MHKAVNPFAKFKVGVEPQGAWSARELDDLFKAIGLFTDVLGGVKQFRQRVGRVTIERSETRPHLGLAYHEKIRLSAKEPFSTWSVVHELAHVWDARNDWKFSRDLEKFTGGFTSRFLSYFLKLIPGRWDAGQRGPEHKPGLYGRKPGCNAAGYFYGERPGGSNWQFNRREDFAESAVMYCGWGRDNALSRTAHGRIERYLLPNGRKDPIYRIADNWSDYAHYFYPPQGDYTQTRRWGFIHQLIHNGETK